MYKFKQLFVLLIFAALVVSCNKTDTTKSATASTASEPATGGLKIVYIDVDSFLDKYNLYQDKKKSLENQTAATDKDLGAKLQAFQKKAAKFQQEVYEIQQKAPTIAPVELKKLEEKFAAQQASLAKEEESLMKQRDKAASSIDGELVEFQKTLKKSLDDYLATVAKEKHYDYVLTKGNGGAVLYGPNTLDITQETVDAMNNKYKEEKSSK